MRRYIGLATIAGLLAIGCSDPTCVTATTTYAQSIDFVGNTVLTEGMPIARFDVTQNFVSHTPYKACLTLQDVGVVDLTVTSTASSPMFLVYDVQGLTAGGNPAWGYRDTIPRITPGQAITRNRITTTPTLLSLGARVIVTVVNPVP
jgi:hypothetical protein